MLSIASIRTPGDPPSGARGTPSRACVLCRRVLAQDDVAIDIHGVSAHALCAAYRRRRVLR